MVDISTKNLFSHHLKRFPMQPLLDIPDEEAREISPNATEARPRP